MTQDNYFLDVGARVQALRGNFSQAVFADRLGVDRKTVVGWEAGKRLPDGTSLLKLANEFGADVNYLLTGLQPEDVALQLKKAAEVDVESKAIRKKRIAQAVAMLEICTSKDLDTLVDGVLAMGNTMARHGGHRVPGVTTWHPNDAKGSAI